MKRPRRSIVGVLLLASLSAGCHSHRRALGPHDLPPVDTRAGVIAPSPVPPPASVDRTPDALASSDVPPSPKATPRPARAEPSPVFADIRVDAARGFIEIDAEVSSLIHEPYEGRFFYLEQFVCRRGTKDHESLLVTDAMPSQIHAALLLIGLEPGRPAVWEYPQGRPVAHAPTGPPVTVEFLLAGGSNAGSVAPHEWTTTRKGSRRFPDGRWVFAGSAIAGSLDAPFYEADAAGTIVGLASFGTEVVAWADPISHDESDEQLEWVADLDRVPPPGTPVVVRIGAVATP